MIRQSVLQLIRKSGWEVSRISALPERRKIENHARAVQRWRFLNRYDVAAILDIGANVGQYAQLVRECCPDTPILSFEPLPDCADQLESLSETLTPHRVIRAALGTESGTVEMNRNASSPSSSLLEMETLHQKELPKTKGVTTEQVALRRLDEVMEDEAIDGPLFVKIDVQGFEREVILGGPDTIRRSSAVVMEVSLQPLYKGAPTFDDLYQIMRGFGFSYQGNVDQWTSKSDGRILQCDCLFENNNLVNSAAS